MIVLLFRCLVSQPRDAHLPTLQVARQVVRDHLVQRLRDCQIRGDRASLFNELSQIIPR